ncbi:MAG: DUF1638 domain-containing protein [Acidimicrobiales bacterium]
MSRPLVLACGALVSELRAVLAANSLTDAIEVGYLPANLHNRPERIVPTLRELVAQHTADDPDRPILVGYADCGTGGQLDTYLAELPHATRLPGAHCYEFFAGTELFTRLHDADPGTFYLTDFLAKHFDALVWGALGLDRHPELRDAYFGNYSRVVLFSQTLDESVVAAGRAGAERLGLAFEHHHVGLDHFADAVTVHLSRSTEPTPGRSSHAS